MPTVTVMKNERVPTVPEPTINLWKAQEWLPNKQPTGITGVTVWVEFKDLVPSAIELGTTTKARATKFTNLQCRNGSNDAF